MKNLIKLFVIFIFVNSCGDFEEVIYDNVNGQTLGFFDGASSTLEVEINSSATVDIPIGVSTISTSDRTVTVSVDADGTSATAGMYSFNPSVTIPANEYFGTLTVTGIDDGLSTAGAILSLKIETVDGGVPSTALHSVNLIEICPIDATFATGDYTLTHVSGGIAAAGFAPAMGTGITVTLVPGTSSTERLFNVKFYPSFGFSNPPVDFSFNLVCETITINGIPAGQASGVGCGGSIAFGPASTLGSYTTGDDTNITLIFAEDTEEICGTVATTTVTLTKI